LVLIGCKLFRQTLMKQLDLSFAEKGESVKVKTYFKKIRVFYM